MSEYKSFTDEELIRSFRSGTGEIMDYLMEKYKDLVRREAKAMYLLGGEREDLIQEGMIGLFKAVRDYDLDQGTSFSGFAKLCVRRQMYSAIEASKRKKHIPLNSYVSLYEEAEEGKKGRVLDMIEAGEESNPETAMISREYAQDLETELKENLSALEQEVLHLHLLGNDYRRIAEIIGRPPKTIDNAIQRIRAKAQRVLDSESWN